MTAKTAAKGPSHPPYEIVISRLTIDKLGVKLYDKVSAVVAELVANVLSVSVTPGDRVAVGDAVVLLESMKMEIPVLVESAGVVAEIAVNEGDIVQEGDLIARVE